MNYFSALSSICRFVGSMSYSPNVQPKIFSIFEGVTVIPVVSLDHGSHVSMISSKLVRLCSVPRILGRLEY
jgi:hypothetical protein